MMSCETLREDGSVRRHLYQITERQIGVWSPEEAKFVHACSELCNINVSDAAIRWKDGNVLIMDIFTIDRRTGAFQRASTFQGQTTVINGICKAQSATTL